MAELITNLKEKLEEFKAASEITFTEITNYPCLEIPKEKLTEISKILKNDLSYDQLMDIVGVDRFTKENRFEVIYNLWSNETKSRIFIRVKLDSKNPEVETLTSVWSSANWAEREVYDMYGVNFINHPDPRRMYMMEDYEYYPLRKDYPLMGLSGAAKLPKK